MLVRGIVLGYRYVTQSFVAAGVDPVMSNPIAPIDMDTVSIVHDEIHPNSSMSRARPGK